jgi:hypothetical protein
LGAFGLADLAFAACGFLTWVLPLATMCPPCSVVSPPLVPRPYAAKRRLDALETRTATFARVLAVCARGSRSLERHSMAAAVTPRLAVRRAHRAKKRAESHRSRQRHEGTVRTGLQQRV